MLGTKKADGSNDIYTTPPVKVDGATVTFILTEASDPRIRHNSQSSVKVRLERENTVVTLEAKDWGNDTIKVEIKGNIAQINDSDAEGIDQLETLFPLVEKAIVKLQAGETAEREAQAAKERTHVFHTLATF